MAAERRMIRNFDINAEKMRDRSERSLDLAQSKAKKPAATPIHSRSQDRNKPVDRSALPVAGACHAAMASSVIQTVRLPGRTRAAS
jgi:hypothetical protein